MNRVLAAFILALFVSPLSWSGEVVPPREREAQASEPNGKELLQRHGLPLQARVLSLNACGEVDDHVVGESCEYTLELPSGKITHAWLVGTEEELSPGAYRIRFLEGDPRSSLLRWNIFSVLQER